MAAFSQTTAAIQITSPLGPDAFVVFSFRGKEELSGLFEFTLELGAPLGSPVPFSSLIGNYATVTLLSGGSVQRHIHGMICEFYSQNPDRYMDHYRMVLRPRLWQLGLVKQSRVFQLQNASQILTTVLSPASGSVQIVLPTPDSRIYCTQYRETDLEFAQRLCSEEGIAYYWVHSESNHQLTLVNNTTQAPSCGNCQFNWSEGGSQNTQAIKRWETGQQWVNNQVTLLDSHFELFNQPLAAQATGQKTVTAGTVPLQVNGSATAWQENPQSPARYFDAVNQAGTLDPNAISPVFDAIQNRAQNLATAAACRAVVARGEGNCMNLMMGYQFTLDDHPNANGDWLVISLEHEAKQEGLFWQGEEAKVTYTNRFEAVPAAVNQKTWPPIPRPVVGSVETAIVTGPSSQEAFLDPYGRVQVRFWWNANSSNESTSCWVRVAQFWAGQSYGAFFWPRVGHEVVVAFEHGDPDRPIIVGSVYNSTNTTPYSMPGNTYIAGFRTKTQGGTAADNCHKFTLSDVPGSEIINLHAESMLITNQEKTQFSMRSSSNISIQ